MSEEQQREMEPEREHFIVTPDNAFNDYDIVEVKIVMTGPIEVGWQGHYVDYKAAFNGVAHIISKPWQQMIRFPLYTGMDTFVWISINEIITISVSRINPEGDGKNSE